jgi:hypothetical protein
MAEAGESAEGVASRAGRQEEAASRGGKEGRVGGGCWCGIRS